MGPPQLIRSKLCRCVKVATQPNGNLYANVPPLAVMPAMIGPHVESLNKQTRIWDVSPDCRRRCGLFFFAA
jgi:hypothetical protein